ncbi:hypothetical protein N9W34_01130 [Rickettsiales bacterium]|nr:hypothetical protein [Rickettsiales bacterium]
MVNTGSEDYSGNIDAILDGNVIDRWVEVLADPYLDESVRKKIISELKFSPQAKNKILSALKKHQEQKKEEEEEDKDDKYSVDSEDISKEIEEVNSIEESREFRDKEIERAEKGVDSFERSLRKNEKDRGKVTGRRSSSRPESKISYSDELALIEQKAWAEHHMTRVLTEEYLRKRAVEIEKKNQVAADSPLMAAAKAGDWRTLMKLIAEGADTKERNEYGQTVIDVAAKSGISMAFLQEIEKVIVAANKGEKYIPQHAASLKSGGVVTNLDYVLPRLELSGVFDVIKESRGHDNFTYPELLLAVYALAPEKDIVAMLNIDNTKSNKKAAEISQDIARNSKKDQQITDVPDYKTVSKAKEEFEKRVVVDKIVDKPVDKVKEPVIRPENKDIKESQELSANKPQEPVIEAEKSAPSQQKTEGRGEERVVVDKSVVKAVDKVKEPVIRPENKDIKESQELSSNKSQEPVIEAEKSALRQQKTEGRGEERTVVDKSVGKAVDKNVDIAVDKSVGDNIQKSAQAGLESNKNDIDRGGVQVHKSQSADDFNKSEEVSKEIIIDKKYADIIKEDREVKFTDLVAGKDRKKDSQNTIKDIIEAGPTKVDTSKGFNAVEYLEKREKSGDRENGCARTI